MPRSDPALRRALAGALALAAAMGIGRFAYTALLPAAQRALGIDDAVGGAIASVNLLGYLVGVLVARGLPQPARPRGLLTGLFLTALTTAGVAASGAPLLWFALRFLSGVASGLVFVLATTAALDAGPGSVPRPGTLYAGVGCGMAFSGALAGLVPGSLGWQLPWLLLGGVAAALALAAWPALGAPLAHGPAAGGPASGPHGGLRLGFRRLGAAYFLEGLGYIVSGTFAVVAVRRTPGLEALAPWTWTLTGLAAAPSAPLWSALGRRIGLRGALVVAYLTQAAGMALPSVSNAAASAVVGAALFGSTFLGIVVLTMSAARLLVPRALGRAVGTLTALYGVGQIIGPIAAGALSQRLGDPRPAVLLASLAVAAGAALLAWPSPRPSPAP
ncbi:MAG: YbfB/YjiJ family MFS transporter [Deltaproteobacteria bacterium]|nr:YbfB/YjiJ family MFS transporter [Deltaproteobacteria bacterium]